MAIHTIEKPYLLLIGDTEEPNNAKTAFGLRDWVPEAFVGVALNTSAMNEAEASKALQTTSQSLGLPCVDPIRTGVDSIVTSLEAFDVR